MVRVTVELISSVAPSRNRVLGIMEMSNTDAGTEDIGFYNVSFQQPGQPVRRTAVRGFPRKTRGGFDLLFRSLRALGFSQRNP